MYKNQNYKQLYSHQSISALNTIYCTNNINNTKTINNNNIDITHNSNNLITLTDNRTNFYIFLSIFTSLRNIIITWQKLMESHGGCLLFSLIRCGHDLDLLSSKSNEFIFVSKCTKVLSLVKLIQVVCKIHVHKLPGCNDTHSQTIWKHNAIITTITINIIIIIVVMTIIFYSIIRSLF